jgi:hypothetical protein
MRPMMPKGVFADSINAFSLRFSKQELEERFQGTQEENVRGFGRSKQIIVASAATITLTLSYTAYGHYSRDELDCFWALLFALLAGDCGLALEFLIHCFPRLRYIRCIFVTSGCYFASLYYAAQLLPVPGMLPGYRKDDFE